MGRVGGRGSGMRLDGDTYGSMIMVFYILVPLMLLGCGVWVGVWISRKTYKDVDIDTSINEHGPISMVTGSDSNTDTNKRIAKSFEELLGMMREKVEKENAEERDNELVRIAREKYKNNHVNNPVQVGGDQSDRPVKTKAQILIPQNLNSMEKQILEDFYNEADNDNRKS